MRKRLVIVSLLLVFSNGMAAASFAQERGETGNAAREAALADLSAAMNFATSPVPQNAKNFWPLAAPATKTFPNSSALLATTNSAPRADAAPAPAPKWIYGSREDFRWQLGIGPVFFRFRSSIINGNMGGVNTSLVYYTSEWFGIEGNVTAAFGPTVFANEHKKLALYGAGSRIIWRRQGWEPWAHAIFGGVHFFPQTALGSQNAFALQLGGGADLRRTPLLSIRLGGDWVHTRLFSEGQNNLQIFGGVVFHF